MNITDVSQTQDFWQDYARDVLNGRKEPEATLDAYTDTLDALQTFNVNAEGDGSAPLTDAMKQFFEEEGWEIPDYDADPEQLNAQELADIEFAMVDLHEQVTLSNAISEAMQDQIVRQITGTMAEKRDLFEDDDSYI